MAAALASLSDKAPVLTHLLDHWGSRVAGDGRAWLIISPGGVAAPAIIFLLQAGGRGKQHQRKLYHERRTARMDQLGGRERQ